jgi:hypothetical protein
MAKKEPFWRLLERPMQGCYSVSSCKINIAIKSDQATKYHTGGLKIKIKS